MTKISRQDHEALLALEEVKKRRLGEIPPELLVNQSPRDSQETPPESPLPGQEEVSLPPFKGGSEEPVSSGARGIDTENLRNPFIVAPALTGKGMPGKKERGSARARASREVQASSAASQKMEDYYAGVEKDRKTSERLSKRPAKDEGEEMLANAPVIPEQPKIPIGSKEAIPAEPVKDISQLKEEIDSIRKEYAEYAIIEEDKKGLWNRVHRWFKGVEYVPDKEFARVENEYHEKLMELQGAELKRIQKAGLQGKEQEALEGAVRHFHIHEFTALYKAQTQARIDEREKTVAGKTMLLAGGVVDWYQKQSPKKKLLIAASLGLGAAASAGTGAFLAHAVITGARRGLSMAATASTANIILEKKAQKKREEKLETEMGVIKGLLQDENAFSVAEASMRQAIKEIHERVREWQEEDKQRKRIALFIGVGAGLGLSEGMRYGIEHGGNEMVRGAFEKFGIQFTDTIAQEGGMLPEDITASPESQILPPEIKPSVPHISANIETLPVEHADALQEYLEEHVAKRGDNLWKYSIELGKNLGLQGNVDQMRFAKMVENAVRAKLEAQPELLHEVGFKNIKDLHLIAGKPVHLGSLLSLDEVEKIAHEATSSVAPSHEAVSSLGQIEGENSTLAAPESPLEKVSQIESPRSLGGEKVSIVKGEAFSGLAIGGAGLGFIRSQTEKNEWKEKVIPTADISRTEEERALQENSSKSKTREDLLIPFQLGADMDQYVTELPKDKQETFVRELKRLAQETLSLNQLESLLIKDKKLYDYTKNPDIFNVRVSEVLKEEQILRKEHLIVHDDSSDSPQSPGLYSSQSEQLVKLVRLSKEQFGPVAEPGKEENLKSYLERVTGMSRATNTPMSLL